VNWYGAVSAKLLAIVATPPTVSAILLISKASMPGQLDSTPHTTLPMVFVTPTAEISHAASSAVIPSPDTALSK